MRALLPTLKEKKRYLVYEVRSRKAFRDSHLIVNKCQELLGVFDSAGAGVMPIKYDPKKQRGVLRVSHKYVDKVRAALLLTNQLDGEDVMIRTIGVSGILRKTDKWYQAG